MAIECSEMSRSLVVLLVVVELLHVNLVRCLWLCEANTDIAGKHPFSADSLATRGNGNAFRDDCYGVSDSVVLKRNT